MRTIGILAIGVVLAASSLVAESGGERRPPREAWELVTIEAVIEAIDLESRELDLRGPRGNLVTVVADEAVERLDEFKVGDVITAEYWTYVLAEFRDPTPEEIAEPLVIIAEGGKAPEGFPPAAAIGAVVQAVVTIQVIDFPNMEVTVSGPRGNYVTFPSVDPNLIQKLHVGEVAVVTYAEALALSLTKLD
jgi:hypothetical protein